MEGSKKISKKGKELFKGIGYSEYFNCVLASAC
jgi:hypothetical protein